MKHINKLITSVSVLIIAFYIAFSTFYFPIQEGNFKYEENSRQTMGADSPVDRL